MGKTKNKKAASRKSATIKKTKTPPRAARSSKTKKTSKPTKATKPPPKAKPQANKSTSQKKKRNEGKESKRVEAPYPHFRYYRKSGHPALIVGEQKTLKEPKVEVEEYRYRKVMHGKKEGGRNNETVYPNPDPTDKDPMHIAKRVRHDLKENFQKKPLPWIYPKK